MSEYKVIIPNSRKSSSFNLTLGLIAGVMFIVVILNFYFTHPSLRSAPPKFYVMTGAMLAFLILYFIFVGVLQEKFFKVVFGSGSRLFIDNEGIIYKFWFTQTRYKFEKIRKITVIDENCASKWNKAKYNLKGVRGVCIELELPKLTKMIQENLLDAKGIEIFLEDVDGFLNELKTHMPYGMMKNILEA